MCVIHTLILHITNVRKFGFKVGARFSTQVNIHLYSLEYTNVRVFGSKVGLKFGLRLGCSSSVRWFAKRSCARSSRCGTLQNCRDVTLGRSDNGQTCSGAPRESCLLNYCGATSDITRRADLFGRPRKSWRSRAPGNRGSQYCLEIRHGRRRTFTTSP